MAGTAVAGTTAKKLPFTANYKGTATTKIADNVVTINASGAGKGTFVGASKISGLGMGDSSSSPAFPSPAPGQITGTGGTKLTFKVTPGSSACGDEKGEIFSITGHATVLKGTGKLAKAKGTLKLTGTFDHTTGRLLREVLRNPDRLGRNETMRRILTLAAAFAVAAVVIPQAFAADPTPVPFPAPKVVQVFVAAETVTPTGVLANYYAPGSTVVFRAYAVDQKTRKVLTAADVKYFYVTIPNQPNVKLKYNPTAAGATVTARGWAPGRCPRPIRRGPSTSRS